MPPSHIVPFLQTRTTLQLSQLRLSSRTSWRSPHQSSFAFQQQRPPGAPRRWLSAPPRQKPDLDARDRRTAEYLLQVQQSLNAWASKPETNPLEPNESYQRPSAGFLSYLPHSWIPFAELIRLDKPAGTLYLFYPCLFSTFIAASMASPISDPSQVYTTAALFFAGAFVMRGAGCTVNDLWDRNLDPLVERTKFRPIARGAITPPKAIVFLGAQLLGGLGILLQFPTSCLYYGVPSLLLVGIYPLSKRVTNYPQFVLGLTFSWGAIMGFPAMGIDLLADTNALYAALCLYASCVAWTVHYDMIYAHMDIKDDAKAGIKSIALTHEHSTKSVLYRLAGLQAALLAATGWFAGADWDINLAAVLSGGGTLSYINEVVDLKTVRSCQWCFNHGAWIFGNMVALCLFLNYYARHHQTTKALVVDSEGSSSLEADRS